VNLFSKYLNKDLPRRLRTRVLPNLRHLQKSRVRTCRACLRSSLFLQFSAHEEFCFCARCGANLRYELMAAAIRDLPPLSQLDVLELDPNSPIRWLLGNARTHIRTYYRAEHERGAVRPDGASMEDITRLTLPNESVDLIVSSDVLEHVPDALAAFRESYRVLRPGGIHLFTVPYQKTTVQRAIVRDGEIHHLVTPPEYHADPLDPNGILAFWHFGQDMHEQFGTASGLDFRVVKGPEGVANRIVWAAKKSRATA